MDFSEITLKRIKSGDLQTSSTSDGACSCDTPFISLHWLPIEARIRFKSLMLAYRTFTGSAPASFHTLLQPYTPLRSFSLRAVNRFPFHSASQLLPGGTFFLTLPGQPHLSQHSKDYSKPKSSVNI